MATNWGEVYYHNYELHLGKPRAVQAFSPRCGPRSIQVLEYDKVFEGCRVFCTLGLTHYEKDIHLVSELFVPADCGWDILPPVIVDVLSDIVCKKHRLGWGMTWQFGDAIPLFSQQFNKHAIYFARPYNVHEEFVNPEFNGITGSVLLGIFLTVGEHKLFMDKGAASLERHFERNNVDPYSLNRPCSLSSSPPRGGETVNM